MTSDKVRALLNITGKNTQGLADYLGISRPSLNTKLYRGTFKDSDLAKIAEYCNAEYCFIFDDTKINLKQK